MRFFSYPFLTLDPVSGTVPGQDETTVQLTFHSEGMETVTYMPMSWFPGFQSPVGMLILIPVVPPGSPGRVSIASFPSCGANAPFISLGTEIHELSQ